MGVMAVGRCDLGGRDRRGIHFADVKSFTRLLSGAEPIWLALAVGLQGLTYLAQAEIFRGVLKAGHQHLPLWAAVKLSVTKLFVDQALPSSGISCACTVVASLVRQGFDKPFALACLVVDLTAYFLAYVLTVGVALVVVIFEGHATLAMIATCAVFVGVNLELAIVTLGRQR